MPIREKAVDAVIEPIASELFIVGRVPGSEWETPEKKEAQGQSYEQSSREVFVEWPWKNHFAES
jgi:hypothetical protein